MKSLTVSLHHIEYVLIDCVDFVSEQNFSVKQLSSRVIFSVSEDSSNTTYTEKNDVF